MLFYDYLQRRWINCDTVIPSITKTFPSLPLAIENSSAVSCPLGVNYSLTVSQKLSSLIKRVLSQTEIWLHIMVIWSPVDILQKSLEVVFRLYKKGNSRDERKTRIIYHMIGIVAIKWNKFYPPSKWFTIQFYYLSVKNNPKVFQLYMWKKHS